MIYAVNGNFKERTQNGSHPLELGSDVNCNPSIPQRQNLVIHDISLKIEILKIVNVLLVGMPVFNPYSSHFLATNARNLLKSTTI